MSAPESVDAIVVGAGVAGLLTALELLHRGLKVRVIDKDFSGPVRTHVGELSPVGGDPALDELYRASLKAWKDAGTRYGLDLGIAPRGSLDLATSPGRLEMYGKEASEENGAGLPATMLTLPEAVTAQAGTPVGPTVRGAKWSPEAPVISTSTLLEGLRRQLAVKGALIWGQDDVRELIVQGDRLAGVRLAGGETSEAKHIILAAGSLAGRLLKTVGPHLPLRPARTHLLTLGGADSVGFPMIVHRLRRGHIWMKRLREGPLLLAYDGLMDPTQSTSSTIPDERVVAALRQHVATLFPAMAGAVLEQSSTVTAAVTPDFRPALGAWPEMKGLYVATGFGARNYAFAAAAARSLGALVAGEMPPLNLAPFAPNRFATGQWAKVAHPPTLSWPEVANFSSQPQLVGSGPAQFSDNVHMVGKPEAHFAGKVNQIERKVVTAASSQAANKPPEKKQKGRIQMGAVKAG